MIVSHLSGLVAHRRKERHLSVEDLATMVGYRDAVRGSAAVELFERGGSISSTVLWSMARALEIDDDEMEEVIKEDRKAALQAWTKWSKEPIRQYLLIRWYSSVYQRMSLSDLTVRCGQQERFAAWTARFYRRRVCLVMSRQSAIYFDESGECLGRWEAAPGKSAVPMTTYGGYFRSALLCDEFGPTDREELQI